MRNQDNEIRLQKLIADCGVTSRRKAEELILAGRVMVNDEIVKTLGTKVDPRLDTVQVDEQILDPQTVTKHYVILHKPRCVMTTLDDPEGRPTVMDYIREIPDRLYPVGRLDYLSEGLLLLTNDGDFANEVMHPSHGVEKTYEVKVFGIINPYILNKLRAGVHTHEGHLKPKSVRIVKQLPRKTWLEFRLSDGRNREIRRICEEVGVTIDKLKRVAIGGLSVDGIAPGKYKIVSKKQLRDQINNRNQNKKNGYSSQKRTLKAGKKHHRSAKSADDKMFKMFRKDRYYKTVKERKQREEREFNRERTESEANI